MAARETRATFSKDPLTDRTKQYEAMKHFKGAPRTGQDIAKKMKDNAPRTAMTPFYQPFKGGEKK